MKEENNPITLPLETWCSLTVPKCAASKIVMPVYPPWISYKRPTSFPGSLILTPGAPDTHWTCQIVRMQSSTCMHALMSKTSSIWKVASTEISGFSLAVNHPEVSRCCESRPRKWGIRKGEEIVLIILLDQQMKTSFIKDLANTKLGLLDTSAEPVIMTTGKCPPLEAID